MKLGRVVGTVVASYQAPVFDGRRLLLCDLTAPDETELGGYLICVDTVDAGAGEMVLILDEGNSARQIVEEDTAPIRSVIVGVVDEIEMAGNAEG